jgi:integrase/recombinase XerD
MPMTLTVVGMTASSDVDVSYAGDDLVLRLASSACLARFTGTSRAHTESDLRLSFAWCAERQLAPLAAVRLDIERYVR